MTSELISLQCSKCGATLNMPRDSRVLVCPHCNSQHLLEKAANVTSGPYDSHTTVFEGKTLEQWMGQLTDFKPSTQIEALRALSQMGAQVRDTPAVDAIAKLLDNDAVASQAAFALGAIGNPKAIQAIVRRARTLDYSLFETDSRDPAWLFSGRATGTEAGCLQLYCIGALAKLGSTEESIAFLTAVTAKAPKSQSIHNAALRALEALAPAAPVSTASKGCASILVLGVALALALVSFVAFRLA